MQGLDSLSSRCSEYYKQGARFTKWRAPFDIDVSTGKPTRYAIEANMKDLARFALISQAEGLVPLVEPDVTLKGNHNLETAIAINTEIVAMLYHSMIEQGVYMEGCVLKVNMINAGIDCSSSYTVEDIARANLDVLQRTMPTAIPGVNFLSGGQSLEDACARLSCINRMKTHIHPWNISFSWSAAIQMPLFAICKSNIIISIHHHYHQYHHYISYRI
jgi:fructose-bisphosphate aldolase class I